MKLQAIDVVAKPERLLGARGRRGQMHGPVRNGKRVTVPLEDPFTGLEVPEQRIAPAMACGRDVVPANFLAVVWSDRCAEGARQQLRAQADPQYGFAGADSSLDGGNLRKQVPVACYLVAVHGPAEHDQAVVAVKVRYCIGVAPEIDVADAETRVAQQWIERAENLVWDVLEDEQTAHPVILVEPPPRIATRRREFQP